MLLVKGLDYQTVLEGLGHGVLIFDSTNRLVFDNLAVRTILGNDLKIIRAEGWSAAAALFNTRLANKANDADAVRASALASPRPVRFHIFRGGEYIPCWAAAISNDSGSIFTMISIETPDWNALTEILERFIYETREAVDATLGHAELINHTLKRPKKNDTIETVGKRIQGFTRIITTHMQRMNNLLEFLERLQNIRTARVRDIARERRRKLNIADWMEDFIEELDSRALIDPDSDEQDYRARIKINIPSNLAVSAPSSYLAFLLRDVLRNAMMYSMRGTPVTITARAEKGMAQIDITDEGYGIRNSEFERVFQPFQRANQPQIIGEFGYGLSLFLCKHEVEAMNGRIWFDSRENVGTTFSIQLPIWQDDADTQTAIATETSEMQRTDSSSVASV